jgi:HK97 gp10 family phage protein
MLTKAVTKEVDKYNNVLETTAKNIVNRAKELAPKLSGNLSNSIKYTVAKTNKISEITISAEADYAVCIEYGTSKQKPQPYLNPAIDEYIKR